MAVRALMATGMPLTSRPPPVSRRSMRPSMSTGLARVSRVSSPASVSAISRAMMAPSAWISALTITEAPTWRSPRVMVRSLRVTRVPSTSSQRPGRRCWTSPRMRTLRTGEVGIGGGGGYLGCQQAAVGVGGGDGYGAAYGRAAGQHGSGVDFHGQSAHAPGAGGGDFAENSLQPDGMPILQGFRMRADFRFRGRGGRRHRIGWR